MNHHIISIPGQGEVILSGAMLPVAFEMFQRLSTTAQRHVIESPYSEGISADLIEGWLHELVCREAAAEKRSVVSISPVRLKPGLYGMGRSYVEYTSVPLAPWKEDRHG